MMTTKYMLARRPLAYSSGQAGPYFGFDIDGT